VQVSLAYTSVTSNTILSSTAALWTLAFSVVLLGEGVTAAKLACVVAVMGGEQQQGRVSGGIALGPQPSSG
jgi:drug/metabolite transporter (DMT)-like permease